MIAIGNVNPAYEYSVSKLNERLENGAEDSRCVGREHERASYEDGCAFC